MDMSKQQLEPRNCIFLDDMEDNPIVAEKLDVKSYDAVDVLKKLNRQKLSIIQVVESFLLTKYYKMTFIYFIKLDIWYNMFKKKRNFLKL